VSIHAYDLEESTRFYVEVFGMRRVPSPDFEHPVVWLEVGDQQLHLFHRDTRRPSSTTSASTSTTSRRPTASRSSAGSSTARVVAQRARAQRRRRADVPARPAGNLVEVNWPDASTLDRSVVTTMRASPTSARRATRRCAPRSIRAPAPAYATGA
jgi:catechol 2,3-dioxygenase-like lactoylglutathione lyase family enzyme